MAARGEYDGNLQETYIEMMKTRLFDPIGISTATFSIEETDARPRPLNSPLPVGFRGHGKQFLGY